MDTYDTHDVYENKPELEPFTLGSNFQGVVDQLGRILSPSDRDAVLNYIARRVGADKIEVNLDNNTASRRGVTIELRAAHAVVLYKLSEMYPRVVSLETLGKALWGLHRQQRDMNTIRGFMSGLRERVAALGATIENKHKSGYRLSYNGDV